MVFHELCLQEATDGPLEGQEGGLEGNVMEEKEC